LHRNEESLQYFDEAAKLGDDDDEILHFHKGQALERLDRYEEAAACFDAAAKHEPDNAAHPYHCARALCTLGKYSKAIKYFDATLKLSPNNRFVYHDKGSALLGLRKYDSALKLYDKSLQLEPDCIHCLCCRGVVSSMLKHYEDALGCFVAAVNVQPDMESRFLMGQVLEELNSPRGALAHYDSIIGENSNEPFSYLPKAQLLEKLGRHDEALACYDQAIKVLEDFMDSVDDNEAYLDRHSTNPELPIWDCPLCKDALKDALKERGFGPHSNSRLWSSDSLKLTLENEIGHGTLPLLEPSALLIYISKAQLLEQLGRHNEAEECYATYESACVWYRSKPHFISKSWLVFAPTLCGLGKQAGSWYLYALPSGGIFQTSAVLPFGRMGLSGFVPGAK